MYNGNENDRRHVNAFIKQLRQYAYQDTAIVIIGHVSRAHGDWSGSTAWQTGVRSHVTLSREEAKEGEPLSDVRVIELIKANRASAGQQFRVTDRDAAGNWIPWRMADDEMAQDSAEDEPDRVNAVASSDAPGIRRAAVWQPTPHFPGGPRPRPPHAQRRYRSPD